MTIVFRDSLKFNIAPGDKLTTPSTKHILNEPFEAIVYKPTYSTKLEGDVRPVCSDLHQYGINNDLEQLEIFDRLMKSNFNQNLNHEVWLNWNVDEATLQWQN